MPARGIYAGVIRRHLKPSIASRVASRVHQGRAAASIATDDDQEQIIQAFRAAGLDRQARVQRRRKEDRTMPSRVEHHTISQPVTPRTPNVNAQVMMSSDVPGLLASTEKQ